MKKGRNKELIKLRDEALYRRYYYWTEVQRLRFGDAFEASFRTRVLYFRRAHHEHHQTQVGEGGTVNVKPLPKVKVPRLSASQLELFPTL